MNSVILYHFHLTGNFVVKIILNSAEFSFERSHFFFLKRNEQIEFDPKEKQFELFLGAPFLLSEVNLSDWSVVVFLYEQKENSTFSVDLRQKEKATRPAFRLISVGLRSVAVSG